jgi:hypothetical protein
VSARSAAFVRRAAIAPALGALAALSLACNAPSFTPASKVESVRILATHADAPYAAPGATVTMTALAADGRTNPATPMTVSWLPLPCVDPPGDAFSGCFPYFAALIPAGVDLGPSLTTGTTFTFQMPADAIANHPTAPGSDPYGLAVVFTFACAGHVEYVPPPAGGPPDAVPFGCFDGAGKRLGADDFVFAYSLVYAFADRTNANPVIDSVTYGGTAIDVDAGVTVPRCTKPKLDDCPTKPLDVVVPASSQEVDPNNLDFNGAALKEEIYVDYYVTAGKVADDTIILYDPHRGRLSGTGDAFTAPQAAGDSWLWVVVHDDRGGEADLQIPVHAM